MHIGTLFAPQAVIARLNAPTRKLAILGLGRALASASGLDLKAVCEAVMNRERIAPTGIGFGIALPHAQIDGLAAPVCGLARLEHPVDFRALDGVAADLVVMLLSPRHDGVRHLKALACLARFLRRSEIREKLRSAAGLEGLLTVFETLEASAA